jgi:hypothetical protein
MWVGLEIGAVSTARGGSRRTGLVALAEVADLTCRAGASAPTAVVVVHGGIDADAATRHHVGGAGQTVDGCVEGCVHGCVHGCVDGCVDGCIHGCVHGCVDGCVHGCVRGRVEGYVDGCVQTDGRAGVWAPHRVPTLLRVPWCVGEACVLLAGGGAIATSKAMKQSENHCQRQRANVL